MQGELEFEKTNNSFIVIIFTHDLFITGGDIPDAPSFRWEREVTIKVIGENQDTKGVIRSEV
jgi:hypothetical protein